MARAAERFSESADLRIRRDRFERGRASIDHDRGPKLRFYKSLPTVQHIVLAYSDQIHVEQTLALEAVDFRIEIAQVYFDLGF